MSKMSLRKFVNKIDNKNCLKRVSKEVDPYLEVARTLRENEGSVVLFERVKNSDYRIIGGICSSRDNFSLAIGCKREGLLQKIIDAVDSPRDVEIVKRGSCQEVVERDVNLYKIPILTYTSEDMGSYITSGVFIANDTEFGYNMSFHRASPISKDRLVARICQRDLYRYMERSKKDLSVSICIGLDPSVLLAAAISIDIKTNELEIANSLSPLKLVRCKTNDLLVPADSEIVLEGRITREKHIEGPFLDITRTYDTAREEPVIEIDCITHRRNPIYQALLPASREHELLMGMPREPVIYRKVNEICKCRDVILTHGGCSWLHGIVKIDKKNAGDGKKAINAAFEAHPSMKHVIIVDDDIDIHKLEEVEWSIATRFQAGRDLVMKRERGSSLDPSADDDRMTYKIGLDATIPWDIDIEKFKKIELGK
ncbi:MAG TPA: UbiD family decarboxylase [Candidatus Altiarchaeales archaeon]|nr:UbiD family decarboxylase [Candidatus Altiarchaeales archaeon]